MYKIAVIGGSIRPDNFTWKAASVVLDELNRHEKVESIGIDPREYKLLPPGGSGDSDSKKLTEIIEKSTGVVVSTPEYHGTYSSVIKLVIENLGFPSVLSGKPVALLGVAAGQIGAIKALEHLRSVCSHIGCLVLPGPVSVAGVQRVFNAEGKCTDEKIEQRLRKTATGLIDYIEGHICPRLALEAMVREN